jgi:hypothetical protein
MTTKIRVGRDISLAFGPLLDSDGVPIDLSGSASASYWIGKSAFATDADVFVKKSSTSGGIVIASSTVGTVTTYTAQVVLRPADTTGMPPSLPGAPYYHELQVKDAAGRDYTFEMTDGGALVLLPSLVPPL